MIIRILTCKSFLPLNPSEKPLLWNGKFADAAKNVP